MGMRGMKRIIDINELYEQTWLKYKMYSSTNYRLYCPNGMYIILNEKENYLDGKLNYILQIYIEPGFKIKQYTNVDIDKKRLKYISIEEYIDNMFKKGEDIYGLKRAK
jgi:hypothetical protein